MEVVGIRFWCGPNLHSFYIIIVTMFIMFILFFVIIIFFSLRLLFCPKRLFSSVQTKPENHSADNKKQGQARV